MMRPFANHVHAALLRAIASEVRLDAHDREKPILVVEEIRSVDWASATFIGTRHEFDLRFEGAATAVAAAADRLVEALPEADIPISGHIVAEIAVAPGNTTEQKVNISAARLTVNVLTIVD
jgi:glutamate racemase